MTTNKHGLFEALKHVAFEDEPEAPQSPAPPTAHTPPPPVPSFSQASAYEPPPMSFPSAIDTGTVPDNDEVYQRLLAKTDFESTDAAATIHKFLDPLKDIPDTVMPPNVKFKTAVLQAKAQAGLTGDSILATFDSMAARLHQEQDAFGEKAKQFIAREVAGRQDHIAQITTQIEQLQQQLAQLSSELVEAQGKGTHAQSQFVAAAHRREIEIEQQKEQYASLLKG